MKPEDFWEMSLDEIDIYFEQKRDEEIQKLYRIQNLATLITNGVALVLNGSDNTEIITIEDLYPDLFYKNIEMRKKLEQEKLLAIHKANMDAYMSRMNKKRKGAN